LNGGENTSSVDEVVSNIAAGAFAASVEGVALVRDGHTDAIVVEDPVTRALKASLLVPVPLGAADVSDFLDGGKNASSIDKIVANIAADAVATLVEGVAKGGDLDTDTVLVEDPVVRALQADLFVPVPGGTAGVSGVGVGERHAAGAVAEVVARVAAGAEAGLAVPGGALVVYGLALVAVVEETG
jgi:hypothetical protein